MRTLFLTLVWFFGLSIGYCFQSANPTGIIMVMRKRTFKKYSQGSKKTEADEHDHHFFRCSLWSSSSVWKIFISLTEFDADMAMETMLFLNSKITKNKQETQQHELLCRDTTTTMLTPFTRWALQIITKVDTEYVTRSKSPVFSLFVGEQEHKNEMKSSVCSFSWEKQISLCCLCTYVWQCICFVFFLPTWCRGLWHRSFSRRGGECAWNF